jgi:DNA polymerase I-like protein with 3'-5' exonuclease and polymerase domains
MPLINLDSRQLEWVCAAYLSKDRVAYKEIQEGVDLHLINQERFKLPTRVVAKNFLFRMIYADPSNAASAFGHDPKFAHVSRSRVFWQRVIDEAYNKYEGLERWHSSIIQEVSRTGVLAVVTGRQYRFQRIENNLPIAKIFNYPVQGLGHDLMALVRVSLFSRLRKLGLISKLVSTEHDSVLLDCPKEELSTICSLIFQVFKDVPRNFEKLFKVPFDLPLTAEITVGPTWGNMEEINDI